MNTIGIIIVYRSIDLFEKKYKKFKYWNFTLIVIKRRGILILDLA
jgi:hypothetical protein